MLRRDPAIPGPQYVARGRGLRPGLLALRLLEAQGREVIPMPRDWRGSEMESKLQDFCRSSLPNLLSMPA
uniref:Uncharacterized protein n=1 Tax=Sphaerodactylus townsendi TaxID=933632 RepID=A0ACB8EZS4_9SAUR